MRKTSGEIPERPNGADCKSVVYDFGGSNPPLPTRGSSSFGRATAFQAVGSGFETRLPLERLCSSGVEHFLGKEGVISSILIKGSR